MDDCTNGDKVNQHKSDDDDSSIPYFGESGDKVHKGKDKVDDGTNGDRANQHKPTEEEKNARINFKFK